MAYHFNNPDQETIFKFITDSQVIAIVGLSDRQETAAYQVAKVMQDADFKILPVNPKLAGSQVLGEEVYPSLSAVQEPIDIVCVFRRSEFLADVAREFVTCNAKVFWAQLGLESKDAEDVLKNAGCQQVVMNKCLKVEYLKSLEA